MPSRTEPKPHNLHWFPSLHMPPKQMAFVGHSYMCPDSLDSSLQMALPLGNVETQFYLCFFPRAVRIERSLPFTQCHSTVCLFFLNPLSFGFPGASVVKDQSANVEDMDSIPGLGISHMPWSNEARVHNYWACTLEPRSCNYWAHSHNYWSLCALEPMLLNKRRHCNEKPEYHNEK